MSDYKVPKMRFEFWTKDLSAARCAIIRCDLALAKKLVDETGVSITTEAVVAREPWMNRALNIVLSEVGFALKALNEVKTTEAERLIVSAVDHLDFMGKSIYGSY